MGMAASQARLLSITSRMADNELKAQIINNSKMRLATESSKVSENYINALNSATMMFTNYNTEGDSQYQKLTFNSLTSYSPYNNQYGLINPNGQILVSENEAAMFKAAIDEDEPLEAYLKSHGLEYKTTYFDENSACPDIFTIKYLNDDGEIVDAPHEYSRDELEEYYNRYLEALQSVGYEEFTTLYNNYQLQEALYNGVVADELRKELLEEIKVPNQVGPITSDEEYSFKEGMDQLLKSGDNFNTMLAYAYLLDRMEYAANNGYIGRDSDFYTDIVGAIAFNDDNSGSVTINQPVDDLKISIDSAGNYIYEFEKIDSTNFQYKISSNGNSYVIADAQNTGNINFSNTDLGTDPTKANQITVTINDTDGETDKFNLIFSADSDGNLQISKQFNTDDEYVINSSVKYLYNEFLNRYQEEMRKGYATVNASDPAIADQKDAYEQAKQKLLEFIFKSGTQPGDLKDDRLDDIPYLIAKYRGQNQDDFTEEFKDVECVYVIDELFNEYGEPAYGWVDEDNPDSDANAKATWYTNLFERMQNGYRVLEDGLASSNSWIQFALESGIVTMEQVDQNKKWTSTLHTNCSDITEVTDDVAIARAEAEYKREMNNIENKDKRLDIELKNIDTEHNSLQKEYESIKKVIDRNIQRTFKMYS